MERVFTVFVHIDFSVDGDQRCRIGIIAVSYNVVDIEFRSVLKHCAVPAPYFKRRNSVDYGIAEHEILRRFQKTSEQ